MVGDNGRDMTYKECQDYVNALAPKAPASLTKQFTNVDVPNTSRLKNFNHESTIKIYLEHRFQFSKKSDEFQHATVRLRYKI